MRILALDTSTEYLSLALLLDEQCLLRDSHALQSHSAQILPQIQQMLQQTDCQLSDLDAIAFGAGPGSFTGLRIACGVAQGLAFANDLPVVAVSTLQALVAQSEHDKLIACLDARMGEVYLAAYQRVQDEYQTLLAPCLCRPDQAPAILNSQPAEWRGVGTGWQVYGAELQARYAQQLAPTYVDDSVVYPSAATIAKLAVGQIARGEVLSAAQASPIYVRNKVALTTQERQA
jgi:tRNA threonylcarbamoyladenosine biosynthesis protein TsaB